MGAQAERIAELRDRIGRIARIPLAERRAEQVGKNPFTPGPGLLHEVFTDASRDAGAGLGFALAQGRSLLGPERPALILVGLVSAGQELGLAYAGSFPRFGLTHDAVLLVRVETVAELLWATEEAAACRAVAAVIADIPGSPRALDFTASRRLSLRTAAAESSVFLLRYGEERAASAARLRWHVAAAPSRAPPFDARAPGGPRWQVTIEKGRLAGRPEGEVLLLDWTEDGFVPADERKGAAADGAIPALRGARPALLGHRLHEAG